MNASSPLHAATRKRPQSSAPADVVRVDFRELAEGNLRNAAEQRARFPQGR